MRREITRMKEKENRGKMRTKRQKRTREEMMVAILEGKGNKKGKKINREDKEKTIYLFILFNF